MFYQSIKDAIAGKIIWECVKNTCKSDMYIIVPNNIQLKALTFFYLESYCKRTKIIHEYTYNQSVSKGITIITSNSKDKNVIDILFNYEYRFQIIPEDRIAKLLKFYALVDSSLPWIIASIDQPYDTHAHNLVVCGLSTMKEIVCFDIYGMNCVPKVKIPEYTGNDVYINLLIDEVKNNVI